MTNPTPLFTQAPPPLRKRSVVPLIVGLTVAASIIGMVLLVTWTIYDQPPGPNEPYQDSIDVSADGSRIAFVSSAGIHHAGLLEVREGEPPQGELKWRSQVGPWVEVGLRPGEDALYGIERSRLMRVTPDAPAKPFSMDDPETPIDDALDRGIEKFAWHPSGRYLAAIRLSPETARSEVFVWDTEARRATVVARQAAAGLGWSPDGTRLFLEFPTDHTSDATGHWLILTWPDRTGRRVRYPDGFSPLVAAFDSTAARIGGLFAGDTGLRALSEFDLAAGTFEPFGDAKQPFFRSGRPDDDGYRSFAVCRRRRIYWQEKVSHSGGRIDLRRYDPDSGREWTLFSMRRRDDFEAAGP